MPTVRNVEGVVARCGQVLTVSEQDTVTEAACKMLENGVGCLVVRNATGKVAGVLSERDIVALVVARALDSSSVEVREVMSSGVISVTMDTPLEEARRLMSRHGIRHLPIMEGGMPLGMLSSRDIMAHQLTLAQSIARKQGRLLRQLECANPGITRVTTDSLGRIVI